MSGPLRGVHILEIAAIGPAPFGVMLLADMGAEVIRVDRVASVTQGPGIEASMVGVNRNRRSIAIDLKDPRGLEILLRLVDDADVLVEGFRPGVAERLGFGPATCLERNPRLIFARMTGWGQEGPMASVAGHDINYASVAGAIHPIGRVDEPPPPPLNLVADFGGGGSYLAMGVLAALFEREVSGCGQVVDAAMVDGALSLTAFFHGLLRTGQWSARRADNLLDGAAPFYDTYETSDGHYMAVGAMEPDFFREFVGLLGIDPGDVIHQHDRSRWPAQKELIAETFRTRTRAHWTEVFAGSDACVTPVLTFEEAQDHPHIRARSGFVQVDGHAEPAPAPRFSRTSSTVRSAAPSYGRHTIEVLGQLGYPPETVRLLLDDVVVAGP